MFSPADWEAYLDEELPSEQMAAIERALREQPALLAELQAILARRDQGAHSLGEIWRRQRASCPTRSELGSYALGALAREQARFVQLHLDVVGCRFCQASLADLRQLVSADRGAEETRQRRSRYFASSAGLLSSRTA